MAGLGRRLLGAALSGAGAGIIQQAAQQREQTLLMLRRQWQVEDRDKAAEAAAARQAGAGGAGAAEPLEKVRTPDGRIIYVPRSQAAGMEVGMRDPAPPRPQRPIATQHDAFGNPTGWSTPEQALAMGARNQASSAAEDADTRAAEWVEENASWFASDEADFGGDRRQFQSILAELVARNPDRPMSALAEEARVRNSGGGAGGTSGSNAGSNAGSDTPPAGYPDAVRAPPGTPHAGQWITKGPDGRWHLVS